MSPTDFFLAYEFCPDLAGFVGLEFESFTVDATSDLVVPAAGSFLDGMRRSTWGEELSACQVEFRTRPLRSESDIRAELSRRFTEGDRRAAQLGLKLDFTEVAPEGMPLDVFPGNPRYSQISQSLGTDRLRAACRVAGLHIHYGVRNWDHAIAVYGRLRESLPQLIAAGDGSKGERMRLYEQVAVRCDPPPLRRKEELYAAAVENGFADSPRNCWWLIRISPYGTVEVRVFGTTRNVDVALNCVRMVQRIALGRSWAQPLPWLPWYGW